MIKYWIQRFDWFLVTLDSHPWLGRAGGVASQKQRSQLFCCLTVVLNEAILTSYWMVIMSGSFTGNSTQTHLNNREQEVN